MKHLKLAISLLVFGVVLVYAIAFAAHNSSAVTINFLGGLRASLPLSLWVGVFMAAGALSFWIASGISLTRQRLRLRKLERQLGESKRRVDRVG
jgi:uncharacterized membrane protein YciS (DUF1049 family)